MNENNDIFEEKTNETSAEPDISDISRNDKPVDSEIDIQFFSEYTSAPEETENRKKSSHAAIIVLLILIFTMISALTIYCIYTDIQIGSIEFNASYKNSEAALKLSDKPEVSMDYVDENGRYTTEGLAEYIRPQIVEIYTYNSMHPDTVIASGSGIIITEDGFIVTNTHVLDGSAYEYRSGSGEELKADSYAVRTYNDKQYEAKIAGRDTKTDIAVIKIEAHNLPCATFGNSDETVMGEQVAAIGNPAGLSGSITDGIVSGLNRKIKADSTGFEMNCIQTNAAISPGNSGGALVNMYGQVIGITSSKYVNSSYEGLGFAITINEAKPIIDELIEQGFVSGRVRVGITFYSMDNEFAATEFKNKYNRDVPEKLKGLWITDISDECDVSNTDLKVDDFILSVNGTKVYNYETLNSVLNGKKAGDTLTAECARIDGDMNISYFEVKFKLMSDTSGDF